MQIGRATAHKGLTHLCRVDYHPETSQSLEGGFLLLNTLSDKRKYECQQCKKEHSEGHQVFKIKMFHQHHPHSM